MDDNEPPKGGKFDRLRGFFSSIKIDEHLLQNKKYVPKINPNEPRLCTSIFDHTLTIPDKPKMVIPASISSSLFYGIDFNSTYYVHLDWHVRDKTTGQIVKTVEMYVEAPVGCEVWRAQASIVWYNISPDFILFLQTLGTYSDRMDFVHKICNYLIEEMWLTFEIVMGVYNKMIDTLYSLHPDERCDIYIRKKPNQKIILINEENSTRAITAIEKYNREQKKKNKPLIEYGKL